MIRVQVVNSVAMARRTIRRALEESGSCEVLIESESGAVGLADYRAMRPDVLVVDISLPDMDGVHFLRGIRQLDPDVRAILLAPGKPVDNERERRQAGACQVVSKPIDPAKLVDAILIAHDMERAPSSHEKVTLARVLVVDDDPVFRKFVRRVLEMNDYSVCAEAAGGDEALVEFRRERPDLILLDVNLPFAHGFWALEQIRLLDTTVPVVMVSGSRDRDTVSTALTLGVQGYLCKPLAPERLLQQVATCLGRTPVASTPE